MSRKTTVAAKQAISHYELTSEHYISILRLYKDNPHSLMPWVKEKPIAYYEGMLAATRSFCEGVLMAQKCYRGFQYRNTVKDDILCTVEEVQEKRNYHEHFVKFYISQ